MKFPDVSRLGSVSVEGQRYVVLLVHEDWEPDNDHDKDHARGGCECPCQNPLDVLLDAVTGGWQEGAGR